MSDEEMIDSGAQCRHVLRSTAERQSHDLERQGDDEESPPWSGASRGTERSLAVVVRGAGFGESAAYDVERQRRDDRDRDRDVRPASKRVNTGREPGVRRGDDSSEEYRRTRTRCHQLLGLAEKPLDECGRDDRWVRRRHDGVVVMRDGGL